MTIVILHLESKSYQGTEIEYVEIEVRAFKSAALQGQLEEALSAIEDVESNLCLKFFSLARFENPDLGIQYYTGIQSAWACLDDKVTPLHGPV